MFGVFGFRILDLRLGFGVCGTPVRAQLLSTDWGLADGNVTAEWNPKDLAWTSCMLILAFE